MTTNYAGETFVVEHTATLDGVPLTDSDVDRVTVLAVRRSVVVLDEVEMTWDSVLAVWRYEWETGDVEAGICHVKVTVYAGDATNWEWKDIRLEANPTITP